MSTVVSHIMILYVKVSQYELSRLEILLLTKSYLFNTGDSGIFTFRSKLLLNL